MKRTLTWENLSSEVCEQQRSQSAAHPRSLLSAFIIRYSESIIYNRATAEISII